MYRILVVDDEIDIVAGVETLLQNLDRFDLEIHTALSGFDAVEVLRERKIDVVLSDIVMPGMTGLELLEIVRSDWPDCRVILLTAHDEFKFIYEATRHEGVSYVLKADAFDAVGEAVGRAIESIEADFAVRTLRERAEEYLSDLTPLLRKEYLEELIDGSDSSTEVRESRFRELGIPLDPSRDILLLLGRISSNHPGSSSRESARLRYTVLSISERVMPPTLVASSAPTERYGILWLIQATKPEAEDGETTRQRAKSVAESIQTRCLETFDIPVSLLVDSGQISWANIAKRYGALRMLLESSFGSGNEALLMESDTEIPEVESYGAKSARLRRIASFLECGDLSAVVEELERVRRETGNPETDFTLLEVFQTISLAFVSFLNTYRPEERLSTEMRKLVHIEEHISWNAAIDFFVDLANRLFPAGESAGQDRPASATAKTKRYILDHPGEDLSLARLAERVFFNPSYLSRLFKQETGDNLSHFINSVRIDRAKELLAGSTLRINEIAREVGYDSPSYFTQFFKRIESISPTEYRERYHR